MGCIFSIEEFQTFDGPGIRTTVFFKGCPLRCSWCHNPEGQKTEKQILKNPNGCTGCGSCVRKAMELYGTKTLVPECIPVCPNRLLRQSGEDISAEALAEKLLKNEKIFKMSGGGVTFSGGEPLFQPEFLAECLYKLKGRVHCAVQTSGYCNPKEFSKILDLADYFLFDLKVMNAKQSLRYIGADNHRILENFKMLTQSNCAFVVRIPLIPGVTDTEENISAIIGLLKECSVSYAEALPYHEFSGAKYALCGRAFCPDFNPQQSVRIPAEDFLQQDIELKIL